MEEAMQQLKTRGTTTLSLPTGFGKSICSVYLSSLLLQECGGLVLILTNRSTIQKGWKETILENTDAAVWVIESKIKVPERCNIILTMDGKFQKIPAEILKLVSVLVVDDNMINVIILE